MTTQQLDRGALKELDDRTRRGDSAGSKYGRSWRPDGRKEPDPTAPIKGEELVTQHHPGLNVKLYTHGEETDKLGRWP